MGRQPWLEGPGLELGLQFTYRVGLVFPTKGTSTLNDTLTSLNPSKRPCFPLRATFFPSSPNSLSFSLFSPFLFQSSQPPFFTQFFYL